MLCVMGLRRLLVMMPCVQLVRIRQVSMMGGFLVMAGLVMLGRLFVMLRRVLVVLGGIVMMIVCVLCHLADPFLNKLAAVEATGLP